MTSPIQGRVLGHKGLARPFVRTVIVRLEGIESRGRAEKLVGKIVSLWDHLGLPVRGQVTGVRDDDGKVLVTMARSPSPDHPLARVEVLA